jgi:sugar lactone lactonase YvrE
MRSFKAERIQTLPVKLGEGPCWDPFRQNLLWVDITAGTLNRYDPATGKNIRTPLGQMIGCAAPLPDGRVLAALASGVYIVDDRGPGDAYVAACICRPPGMSARERFNDGKLDRQGRLVAGTMALTGRREGLGHLYSIRLNGEVRELLAGVGISNGLDWSADGKLMYYVDSLIPCVFVFDYDEETGDIQNRRVAFELSLEKGVVPDGLCIDAEGMLWVAHGGGGMVGRYDPATGRMIARVELPQRNTTSCCLGPSGELYITTADDTNADFVDTAATGGLYVADINKRKEQI